MDRKVFILESPKRVALKDEDLSPYGEAVLVFKDDEANRPSVFDPNKFSACTLGRLQELGYNPEDDFLVVLGSMIGVSLLIAAALNKYGSIRILLFSAITGAYVPRVLSVQEMQGVQE